MINIIKQLVNHFQPVQVEIVILLHGRDVKVLEEKFKELVLDNNTAELLIVDLMLPRHLLKSDVLGL